MRETIKSLHTIERPRERLIRYGRKRLSVQELITLVLSSGTKQNPVHAVAKNVELLLRQSDINTIRFSDLSEIPGLGIAKASQLIGALELAERLTAHKDIDCITPKDVWYMLCDLHTAKKEHFVTLYLDARNKVIKRETIAIGTVDASLVHPREVFEPAIRYVASSAILAHNHPSGNLQPSDADLVTTKRLEDAGSILGIPIIDHVIIGTDGYLSMKLEGLLSR